MAPLVQPMDRTYTFQNYLGYSLYCRDDTRVKRFFNAVGVYSHVRCLVLIQILRYNSQTHKLSRTGDGSICSLIFHHNHYGNTHTHHAHRDRGRIHVVRHVTQLSTIGF
jgi:hypothetical protein